MYIIKCFTRTRKSTNLKPTYAGVLDSAVKVYQACSVFNVRAELEFAEGG